MAGMVEGFAAVAERLRESRQPVAWRVKDFADGWILCHTLEAAMKEAEGAGNRVEPLYL